MRYQESPGRTGYVRIPRTPKVYPDFGKGNCVCCGKPLPPKKRRYCRFECASAYRRETAKYTLVTWAECRERVLKRDNYTCKDCGGGQELEVHHQVPIYKGGPEFDENNCLTLCRKCHDQRHAKGRKGREHIKVNQMKLEVE